jgi:dihydroorotase/N-acyl-D-amino-acid deacylase
MAPVPGCFKDYSEYGSALKTANLRINSGFFAGMGAIRIAVKGHANTPFTDKEFDAAREYLSNALENGALGLSSGLIYAPESFNTIDETVKISTVIRGKGIYCPHMRWESERLLDGINEVLKIAKMAEVPLHISHFKAAGRKAWEDNVMDRAIELLEKERAAGTDVTVDFYPYDCGSAPLSQMVPPSLFEGDRQKGFERLGTPDGIMALRKLLKEGMPGWDNLSEAIGWDQIYIISAKMPENQRFIGQTVAEAVEKFAYQDAADLIGRLLAAEGDDIININRSMRQEDIDKAAMLPYSLVISDSWYSENPHPRLFGAFPKFLREYVREKKLMTLEAAIYKMTGFPAERINAYGSGLIKPGNRADILIFSPESFNDLATYNEPKRLAVGMDYVFVNGKLRRSSDES